MARLFSCVPSGSPNIIPPLIAARRLENYPFCGLPLVENNMDNDVIDISYMTDDELRTHLRRLSDYYSCPCVNCACVCDRPEKVATCDAYQLWLWDRMKYRGGADG